MSLTERAMMIDRCEGEFFKWLDGETFCGISRRNASVRDRLQELQDVLGSHA